MMSKLKRRNTSKIPGRLSFDSLIDRSFMVNLQRWPKCRGHFWIRTPLI